MNIPSAIGLDGLLQSYKAKFRPNPHSHGYLYKNNQNINVTCSHEQYDEYVQAYETSLNNITKYMWRWAILYFTLLAGGLLTVHLKYPVLLPYIESPHFHKIVAALFMLPFANVGRLPSGMELFDDRLRAVPSKPLVMGLCICIIGLAVVGKEYYDTRITSELLPYFIIGIIGFAFVLHRRGRALRADQRILDQQSSKMKVLTDAIRAVTKSTQILQNDDSDEQLSYTHYMTVVQAISDIEDIDQVFIVGIDWKASGTDYYWNLARATAKHADLRFPEIEDDSRDSIHFQSVLDGAISELERHGLTQYFIENYCDHYDILIVQEKDSAQVEEALDNLQLSYTVNKSIALKP